MAALETDLDRLYVEHVELIQNYLYRLSGDRGLAEDLVQETFYRAMRQLLAGRRIDYISAWLYRIARNLYLDHVKRARPELEPELDEASMAAGGRAMQPEAEALRHEQLDHIIGVMRMLPESQRTALILRDAQGLSYEEVAEAMDLSLSAVKSVILRARRRFTSLYAEGYLNEESGGHAHA